MVDDLVGDKEPDGVATPDCHPDESGADQVGNSLRNDMDILLKIILTFLCQELKMQQNKFR